MPVISLTDFVDIVSSSGTPKATKIGQIKNRGDYEHFTDFWKVLREGIVRMHKKSLGPSSLATVTTGLTDKNKINNFPDAIAGYKKWIGKKTCVWFTPPKSVINHSSTSVTLNPELGISVNGVNHIIKLYFKKEPLSKNRADIAVAAMELELRQFCDPDDVIAILDVRRAKLIKSKAVSSKIKALIDAEIGYVESMWSAL